MSTHPAILYTTGFCGSCERAKALLARKGIAYKELRVDEDPALRQEMMARTGRRTVPQVFIGDTHVGGFDDLHALDVSGGLEPLLKELK